MNRRLHVPKPTRIRHDPNKDFPIPVPTQPLQPSKKEEKGLWKVEKIWEGETAFVIGGGPSLKLSAGLHIDDINPYIIFPAISEHLKPIHNQNIVGANSAFKLGDWVDITFFGDSRWFGWNQDALLHYSGTIVTCQKTFDNPHNIEVKKLMKDQRNGLTTKNDSICWNRSSGGAAINLATLLGAKRIILLGFDMQLVNETANFHNEYPVRRKRPKGPYDIFLKPMIAIKKDADRQGIEILNATSNSKLNTFPRIKFKDIINGL